MNAVIYARYSSCNQSDLSIEGQVAVCKDYAAQQGYHVVNTYIDRAVSGASAKKRLAFRRMIADSGGDFQVVLVYQLDRFSRNRYDSATYKAALLQNGVRVVSARETISSDASGIIMEAMLEGMAEYYSRELSQKVQRGLSINAKKGLYTGAGVPLGYVIKKKQFVICPKTAPIVRDIFTLYLAGGTMGEIARHLNTRGLKTSRGKSYSKCAIRRILCNDRYIGTYKYGSVTLEGAIPPIVTAEDFQAVQARLAQYK